MVFRRVELSHDIEEFVFACDEQPLLVRFDHGNHLLGERRIEQATAELLYQLAQDDAQGRAHAAEQLERRFDQPGVREALLRAAREDDFWSVRSNAISILGRRADPELQAALRAACEDRKSNVRAAALRALGSSGAADQIPFLEAAAGLDSPRGLLRAAATEALRRIRSAPARATGRP